MSRHLTLLNRDRHKHILTIKDVLAEVYSAGISSQPSLKTCVAEMNLKPQKIKRKAQLVMEKTNWEQEH